MTLGRTARRVVLAIAILLLLGLAWTGLSGGLDQLDESRSTSEKAQTYSQLAYGLLALISIVTMFWGRRWSTLVHAAWVLSVMVAAGLASIVWGGTSLAIGLLSAVAALLVALAIIWLRRLGLPD